MDAHDTGLSVRRVCRRCREIFTIEPGEVAYFNGHGLHLPWHCAPCRRARREQSDAAPERT